MKSRFRKTLVVAGGAALVIALIAAWSYLSSREPADRLVFSGTVEADEIQIGSRVGGRISAVLVEEGQRVANHQPILRFETFDLEARRDDARAAVVQAEAALEKTLSFFRPEEIAQARAQAEAARLNLEIARDGPRRQEVDAALQELKAAEADYEIARLSLERIEKLRAGGVVSQQDLDSARTTADRARARREAANQRYRLLEAGTRPEEIDRAEKQLREATARLELVERGARKEEIESARAQVERARATLSAIVTQLAELEVTAPVDAFVEVLRVRPGDLIAPGAPVATLIETDRMWVRVYVPEPKIGLLRLGQHAMITVDTGRSFDGRVEHISSRGEFTPRNVQTREERTHQVFGVRVQVVSGAGELRPGMAADVTINR
jgi:multidrug resistance efflux pump